MRTRTLLKSLVVLLAGLASLAGCEGTPRFAAAYVPRESQGHPWIVATPNPVPRGPRGWETTIVWDPEDGTSGQVYVSVDGGPERIFSRSPKHHEDFRLYANSRYEFSLYSATGRETRLASVRITRRAR